VAIQTSAQSVPSTPSWFSEVTVIAHYLGQQGVLSAIEKRVRFARRRFGHYDLIDFAVVLLGYAISGERNLEAVDERVQPFANTFMALFGREHLPHRSTLSRFLAALDQVSVEALRAVFLEDLLARPLEKEEKAGGLWDPRIAQRDCCRAKSDLKSESCSKPDAQPARDGRNRRTERKKGGREQGLRNSKEKRLCGSTRRSKLVRE